MRIALATCSDLPAGDGDDATLVAAFQRHGARAEWVLWDRPPAEADWPSFDGVLLRSTWDYPHRASEFAAWARTTASQTRLINGPAMIEWNVDKTYLRSLADAGVPVIATAWLRPSDAASATAIAAAATDCGAGATAFLKPVIGAGALGTHRFSPDGPGCQAAAQAAASWLADHPHPADAPAFMLQPFLDSVGSRGEVSVIFAGDPDAVHGVRKVPLPGDYRVQDDHGASDEPWPVPPDLARLAAHVRAHAERLTGTPAVYARADFLDAAPSGTPESAADWRLVELELVEPSLFFRHAPGTADTLAAAVLAAVRSAPKLDSCPAALTADDPQHAP